MGPTQMSMSRSDEVYLDEPWLSVIWDPELRCIYAKFKAFANSSEFRVGTMKIVDAIRARNASALISDNRKLEGVAAEDQLWIRDTWTALAVAAGLKRIAVVLAPQGLGKFASEEILSQMGDTVFATQTFESLPDAMRWIGGSAKQPKK